MTPIIGNIVRAKDIGLKGYNKRMWAAWAQRQEYPK